MTRVVAESFTLTHAKHLASKVTADMRRCQGLYTRPSNDEINNYGTELAMLLKDGYVSVYEFGFQREGERVVSWRYAVSTAGALTSDDRPGKIFYGADVSGAHFFNQLTFSSKWSDLPSYDRERIQDGLPVQRVTKEGPKDGNGIWIKDLCYSSNGIAMPRETFRPL